jgi:hypothetical protein
MNSRYSSPNDLWGTIGIAVIVRKAFGDAEPITVPTQGGHLVFGNLDNEIELLC